MKNSLNFLFIFVIPKESQSYILLHTVVPVVSLHITIHMYACMFLSVKL